MVNAREFPNVLTILRRRLWLILLLFVATMAVVAYTAVNADLRYRASVKLQVIAIEPEEVTLFSAQRTVGSTEQILATTNDFIATLVDARIAWQTIGELRLPMNAGEFRERLNVSRVGEYITVQFDGDTPQDAQAAVTRHVANAQRFYQETRARPAVSVGAFVENELAAEEEVLAAAKDALLKFNLRQNVGALDEQIGAYQALVRSIRTNRDTAIVEAERARTLAASWEVAAGEAAVAAQTLRDQATAFRVQVEAARLNGVENTEAAFAASLATQQADAQEALERSYRSNAVAQQATADAQRAAATEYDRILVQRESELASLIGLQAEYDVLVTNVQQAQDDYNFLRAKAREARLKEKQALELGSLVVVEEAAVPQTPVAQQTFRIGLVAAVVSLMAGVVLAFLLEFLASLGRSSSQAPMPTGGRVAPR